MRADQTEEMERDAGAPDEDAIEQNPQAAGEAAKQGSGLPEGFSIEQMLRGEDGSDKADKAEEA